MIDNGSKRSFCRIAQLEACESSRGDPTPMRKLKGHYAISGHEGSEGIGAATFNFSYGDTVLEFVAPILKNADFTLILGRRYQDQVGTHGVQLEAKLNFSFGDGLWQKVFRDFGHLWLRWGTKLNACAPRQGSFSVPSSWNAANALLCKARRTSLSRKGHSWYAG